MLRYFYRLVDILTNEINRQTEPYEGKVVNVYEWSKQFTQFLSLLFSPYCPVSKVTLDIICETAFGYHADSLHNPHNELAHAYDRLLSLQSGKNDFIPRTYCS